MLLNGIVGEMYEVVVNIIGGEGLGGGPDVPLLEEVHMQFISQKSPYPYIEFSVLNQKGLFYIFLDHKRAGV